ncbi:uncharacterized protein LOC124424785 [Vespa crabro]|uniref:uncharacterized protein LOC124424785 n=1 Tax=Vespa crabro TaxID=7445 RepID=UPI001F0024D6|nr:uncharacterized protein LOC124424785 [Vespa crabro]
MHRGLKVGEKVGRTTRSMVLKERLRRDVKRATLWRRGSSKRAVTTRYGHGSHLSPDVLKVPTCRQQLNFKLRSFRLRLRLRVAVLVFVVQKNANTPSFSTIPSRRRRLWRRLIVGTIYSYKTSDLITKMKLGLLIITFLMAIMSVMSYRVPVPIRRPGQPTFPTFPGTGPFNPKIPQGPWGRPRI